MPLRQSLSGLMTDLAISEGSVPPVSAQGLAPTMLQPRPQTINAGTANGPEISSIRLSDAFGATVPQTIGLLLASYRDRIGSDKNAQYASNPPVPSKGLERLMTLCCALGSSGEEILEQLLTTVSQQVTPDATGLSGHSVDACMLLFEGAPVVLRWWKDQTDGRLPYPVCHVHQPRALLTKKGNLVACLKAAFNNQKEALDLHEANQQITWDATLAAINGDSEDGSFAPADGWLVSRLPNCSRKY
jgi:hypothetical protein